MSIVCSPLECETVSTDFTPDGTADHRQTRQTRVGGGQTGPGTGDLESTFSQVISKIRLIWDILRVIFCLDLLFTFLFESLYLFKPESSCSKNAPASIQQTLSNWTLVIKDLQSSSIVQLWAFCVSSSRKFLLTWLPSICIKTHHAWGTRWIIF